MKYKRSSLRLHVVVAALLALLLVGMASAPAKAASTPTISYRTSVQNSGWNAWQKNGTTAGKAKRSAKLEALQVKLSKAALKSGSVVYRVHIAGKGWQGWKPLGATAGYVGKGKAVDAVRIKLKGTLATKYDVLYRVYVGGTGWLGWAKNGAAAGVTGGTANVGALKIKLVAKGQATTGTPCLDLTRTQAVRLKHHMTRSLCQLDYGKNFQHGGCCAMAYAVGISIITKRDVNPTSYYRKDWVSPKVYLCYFDDGHVGTYRSGFDAQAVYNSLRAGRPTLVHYTYATGQHWVCVTGVRAGVDTKKLTYADFTALDPYFGKECPLTDCSMFARKNYVATQPMV